MLGRPALVGALAVTCRIRGETRLERCAVKPIHARPCEGNELVLPL